ncbi:MAG: hypothetical protein ABIS20_18220 [Thermoanaerobaculia bacterium]
MSSDLSIAQVLKDLEAQVKQLEGQEAFHAQQEGFHREQRALRAGELESIRQRYEAFQIAAKAAGEVVRRVKIEGADESAPPVTISRMISRVIEGKVNGEKFTPSAMAAEVNETFGKRLRRPVTGRTTAVALSRLADLGWVHLVRKGKPFHEAIYAKGRKP